MNAKWISIGVVGSLFAASHIGMIGMLATRNGSKLPQLNMPVGPYTSYVATADEDGYKISYSANDPKTMHITKDIVKPSGFLGFGKSTTQITEEYVMDGATNQGGPVSNPRSWQDGSAKSSGEGLSKSLSRASRRSVVANKREDLWGLALVLLLLLLFPLFPLLVGLAAGWVAMFGGEQGAEIGGNMVNDLNDACEVEDGDTNNQD